MQHGPSVIGIVSLILSLVALVGALIMRRHIRKADLLTVEGEVFRIYQSPRNNALCHLVLKRGGGHAFSGSSDDLSVLALTKEGDMVWIKYRPRIHLSGEIVEIKNFALGTERPKEAVREPSARRILA